MIKRLSVLFALFFILIQTAFAGSADEKRLLKMVPADADTVVSVTGAEWNKIHTVRKRVFESRNVTVFTRRAKFSFDDLKAAVFWRVGEKTAILTLWNKPFEPEKIFAAPHFLCSKEQKEGSTIYHVKSNLPAKAKKKAPAKVQKFCVIQLPGGVTGFFTDPGFALGFAKKPRLPETASFAFEPSLKGTLRGVVRDIKLPVAKISFSCSMTGKEQQDFSGAVQIECNTPEEAQLINTQASLAASLWMMKFLRNDPQLAEEVFQCLKFGTSGKKVIIKASFPGALIARMNEYAANAEKMRREKLKKSAKSSGGKKAK